MRLPANRSAVLLAHGLNESEARVYLTLLDHPTLPAATLARASHVPRSHLYTVLQDLHARGLVDVLMDGKSRIYRARPLSLFLERQAAELRTKLADVESQRQTIAEAFAPPPLQATEAREAGDLRLVVGRRAAAREFEEALATARRRVVVVCTEGSVGRIGRHLSSWLADLQGTGEVAVHVFLPPGVPKEALGPRIADAERVHVEKLRVALPMVGLVVDDTSLLAIHPIPDAPDLRAGRDLGVVTSDVAFITTFVRLLGLD